MFFSFLDFGATRTSVYDMDRRFYSGVIGHIPPDVGVETRIFRRRLEGDTQKNDVTPPPTRSLLPATFPTLSAKRHVEAHDHNCLMRIDPQLYRLF